MSAPLIPATHGHPGARVLARIVATEELGAFHRLTVEVPGLWPSELGSKKPLPGQFALLQAEPSRYFLPRAFSIADHDEDLVSFLIAPIGDGSRELSALLVGSEVWVLGPLGRGFDLPAITDGSLADGNVGPSGNGPVGQGGRATRLVVVAGGAGLAPFPLLLRRVGDLSPAGGKTAGPATIEVLVLVGYRDRSQVPGGRVLHDAAERLRERGVACRVIEVSEDGSCGQEGLVTALLAKNLADGDRVVVCGPQAMAAAVWEVCREIPRVRTWFSLEAGMACGVGACHGCVIRLADGTMARVCFEGPVFAGEGVFGRGVGGPAVASKVLGTSGLGPAVDASEGARRS